MDNIKVYPEDIVSALSYLTKTTADDNSKLEDALYWLKTAADNDKNPDYFSVLYQVLSRLICYNYNMDCKGGVI